MRIFVTIFFVFLLELHRVAESKSAAGSSAQCSDPAAAARSGGGVGVEIDEEWKEEFRMPGTVLPLHYDLYIYPKLKEGTFSGTADVHVRTTEPRSYLQLHSLELEIESVKLYDEKSEDNAPEELEVDRYFYHEPYDFLVIVPKKKLEVGKYRIRVAYKGDLTGSKIGIYRTFYKKENGEKQYVVSTQFESTHARRAFPSIDEPSFKSTFSVKLVRPTENYIALSNMPVESEEADSPSTGLTTVTFEKSVPMVTYLACFVVCDFDYKEVLTKKYGTRFRVYVNPKQVDRVGYALGVGENVTDYFNEYFNASYPLPKQDMIGIPDKSGAMENWGLITYGEKYLLYDPEGSSTQNQQKTTSIIAHEVGHMWFGNLVTLKWWDELWINEGFATYMTFKAVSNYRPDWFYIMNFFTQKYNSILKLDSTLSSHPIIMNVSTPAQINEIFDGITYSKGASIIRMLEDMVGPKEFRRGIQNFLRKFSYKNAVSQDLWDCLQAVVDKVGKDLQVSRVMDTWTRQMGYPLIQVERRGSKYVLKQERYLTNPEAKYDKMESPFRYKWDVPVSWIEAGDSSVKKAFLKKEMDDLEIDIPSGVAWTKLNVGQFGFYRVNYPLDDWKKFSEELIKDPKAMDVIDRAGLLNDAFSLSSSDHLPITVYLDMTKFLKKDDHVFPWTTTIGSMKKMLHLLRAQPAYGSLQSFVHDLVKELYFKLGWSDSGSDLERLLRISIIDLACESGFNPCIEEAGFYFEKWIKDADFSISSNLRELVYKYGVKSLTSAAPWNKMLDRYLEESNPQEKNRLVKGLAMAREPWLLHKLLRTASCKDTAQDNEYIDAIVGTAQNPVGEPIAFEYVRANWEKLLERFGKRSWRFARVPKYITSKFSSEFQLKEMREFFAETDAGAGVESRKQALEDVENNIRWVHKNGEAVLEWLQEKNF